MFLAALLLSVPAFSIALVYNIFLFRKDKNIIKTILHLIRELWEELGNLFERLAITLDIIGNIICANLFVDAMFKKGIEIEDTLLGQSGITISSSLGEGLEHDKFRKFGAKFCKFLDKPFEKNHCKNAYEWKLTRDKFNEERSRIVSDT